MRSSRSQRARAGETQTRATPALVTSPKDTENVYIYGSGTGAVRSGEELAGCSGLDPKTQGHEHVLGSEPVVEQRPGVLESEGRKRETLDP